MSRILKAPEVRKQEIIDTAMMLFREKGYDSTSIADIAKEMGVVPGLCYRYFKSKQEIFDLAVKQYAEESCEEFLDILVRSDMTVKERIDIVALRMMNEEKHDKYEDFYHKKENETFHVQLAIEMYKYIAPHISKALHELCKRGELTLDNPETVTDFILLGQLNFWLPSMQAVHPMPIEERVKHIKNYTYTLLGISEE